MRWLITGANGQLGRCAQDYLATQDIEFCALSSLQCDITDAGQLAQQIALYQPTVLLNTAAYTAVDRAESEPELANQINADAVEAMGFLCRQHGVLLIHISTDYVFQGDAAVAYKEEDTESPCSIYGISKLAGEQKLLATGCDALILRTAWVFSEYGNNFVKTMLSLAEREHLTVVADQIGCPTYAGDIAKAAHQLAEAALQDRSRLGVYHYGGDVAVSWWAFAREIFRQALQAQLINHAPRVQAIPSSAYPAPAKRPAFSVLDCSKAAQLGVQPSSWQHRISRVFGAVNR